MKFVRTKRYLKDMKRIGASVHDIAILEQTIASSPPQAPLSKVWEVSEKYASESRIVASAAAEGQFTS